MGLVGAVDSASVGGVVCSVLAGEGEASGFGFVVVVLVLVGAAIVGAASAFTGFGAILVTGLAACFFTWLTAGGGAACVAEGTAGLATGGGVFGAGGTDLGAAGAGFTGAGGASGAELPPGIAVVGVVVGVAADKRAFSGAELWLVAAKRSCWLNGLLSAQASYPRAAQTFISRLPSTGDNLCASPLTRWHSRRLARYASQVDVDPRKGETSSQVARNRSLLLTPCFNKLFW